MTTFIYIPGGLEQVWACISWLHLYSNYLEMMKAQFLKGHHFLGFNIIKKLKNVISGNPNPLPPKCKNDVIKDKIEF